MQINQTNTTQFRYSILLVIPSRKVPADLNKSDAINASLKSHYRASMRLDARISGVPFFPACTRAERRRGRRESLLHEIYEEMNEYGRPSSSRGSTCFSHITRPRGGRSVASQLVVEVVGVGRMWVSTLSPCSFHPALSRFPADVPLVRTSIGDTRPTSCDVSVPLRPSDVRHRRSSSSIVRRRLIPRARVLRLSPPSHRID